MASKSQSAEKFVRALQGRREGAGWMARCPAHEDRSPSLAIRESDGRVLVHCHAGCKQGDVIRVLRDRGIWPESEHDWGEIIATYDYADERNVLLYQVCRFVPKSFRPRRPDGRGGWHWNLQGVRRVLYRLPEVLAAQIVFVVEGEKDANTLHDWGFCGTTNAFGCKAPWLNSYTEALRGREVIIIPDMDEPGLRRGDEIAVALVGVAAEIVLLDSEDLSGAKDISEWFERHSECELIEIVEAARGAHNP
jgi:DNA primase